MYREAVADGLSTAQLEAARLGFNQVLRRRGMSREFVEREGEDLLAQAFFEYSRHLARGEEIRDPVAWILVCAWHRTLSLLEARDRRPRLVSTDRLAELPAGGVEGSPEDELLTEDRLRKVRDAVDRLPGYQRRLLALSYFEGESIRSAARQLGWTPSKAQRAHEAAQRRLHKHLGVETSDELTVVGLAAFLSLKLGARPLLQLVGGVEGALDSVAHHGSRLTGRAGGHARHPFGDEGPVHIVRSAGRRVSELARRLPANGADGTTGLVSGGGAERLVEACKVAAAACVIGGGAIGGSALLTPQHPQRRHRSDPPPARTTAVVRAAPRHSSAPTEAQPVEPTTVSAPPSEPQPRPSEGRSAGGSSASGGSSPTPKTTPAERRAEHHTAEEASVEEEWSGVAKAAQEAEAESRTEVSASGATTDSEETGDAASGGEARQSTSAKQKTEEKTTEEQFRGGLP